MVLITLFIGVVTTSMEEATQEMEAEKAILARIEALRVEKGLEQNVVQSYMQVFRLLDLDGSGSVEEAELRVGLAAIGKYPTFEELREMMDVVDEDGSGQIDIVEFVEFMVHVRDKAEQQKKLKLEAEAAAAAGVGNGNGAAGGRPADIPPAIPEGDAEEEEHDAHDHDQDNEGETRDDMVQVHSIGQSDGMEDVPSERRQSFLSGGAGMMLVQTVAQPLLPLMAPLSSGERHFGGGSSSSGGSSDPAGGGDGASSSSLMQDFESDKGSLTEIALSSPSPSTQSLLPRRPSSLSSSSGGGGSSGNLSARGNKNKVVPSG